MDQQNPYDETQRLAARYPAPGAGQMPMQPGMPMAPGMPGMSGMQMGGAVSPELVSSILGMNQQGAQRNAIDRSRMLAQQLRADAHSGLQGKQTGAVYTGPSWANALVGAYGQYKAGKMEDDANVREQNMGVQNTDALRRYFGAMTGRKTQPQLPHMGDEGE